MLIRQRRAGSGPPALPHSPPEAELLRVSTRLHRRKDWGKILLFLEVSAVLVLLLLTSISARGWLALRQRLPLEGVTLVNEAVAEEPAQLPPIGWRSSLSANQPSPADAALQGRQLEPPAHFMRWLQPAASVTALPGLPQAAGVPATRIVIPSIEVDAPVGEGTDWEALKYRVGHQPGTAHPGQRGNMVLAAHNDVYGEIFRYLPRVPVGEIITVYAGPEAFQYRITERRIITPDQAEVMLPTTGPTVTLISCYPYLIDTHRIVLFGELVS
jgi:sortase A